MANYTENFTSVTGDVVDASELETEFDAIATAIATKADTTDADPAADCSVSVSATDTGVSAAAWVRNDAITSATTNRGSCWDTVNSWFEAPFAGDYLFRVRTGNGSGVTIADDAFMQWRLYSDVAGTPFTGSEAVATGGGKYYNHTGGAAARLGEGSVIITMGAGTHIALYNYVSAFGTGNDVLNVMEIIALHRSS